MRKTITAALAAALAALALLPPLSADALPRGFFGIVPQTAIGPADTARMRHGGIETIRVPLGWAAVQHAPDGAYDWSGFDGLVATAARDRLDILPVLTMPPRWVSRDERRLPIDNARQRRGWSAFVAAAAQRYGTRGQFWAEHGPGSADPVPRRPIRAWQVWNEQNFFYFTRPASPGRYARLLKITSRALKRSDPRAQAILGGLFGRPKQRPPRAMPATAFLDRLYRVRGIKASFDGIALHPYAANVAKLRRLTEAVRRTAVRHRDRRARLYLTEIGWGSAYNPRRVAFEVGHRGQVRELRRAYRYLIANHRRLNLKQVHWFTWKDVAGSCAFCDSSGFFRRGARFKPKPAWHAFRAIARR